jgi:ABC-2 type transport system ATP-binding protein
LPALTTSRGRVIGALLVIAALLVGGLVMWTSRPRLDLTEARVQPFQLTVPAGPGESGTVSLEAVLYLPERTPAPAVLVAHGFGANAASVDTTARELAARGFVALAWSARGFGRSAGQITLDSPDHEIADASRLIDYLARRPEVRQDRPGDPRVGVTGGSYGGAPALLLAGYDRRVDAIAPAITWNNLGQALFPNAASQAPTNVAGSPAPGVPDPPDHAATNGVFKRAWAGILFSAGLDTSSLDPPAPTSPGGQGGGDASSASDARSDDADDSSDATDALPYPADPAGPRPGTDPPTSCGRFAPAVCEASARVTRTGVLDPATAELLWRSSPASVAGRIRVPTLLVQGEADTLFGLDQADATARQIAEAGGTVSVIWYSGGHDGGAPGPAVREQIAAWFDHYLGVPPGGVRAAQDALPSEAGLRYAVSGGVRARRGTDTVRTVIAPRYPGLVGGAPTSLHDLPLHGGPQDLVNPAGGYPASVTSLPGVGGAAGRLLNRIASAADLPGQTATFATEPLPEQLVLAGSPRVRLSVARVPGQPFSAQAVLFAKILDVAPDGRTVLVGGAVAPLRVDVPSAGAQVTVTLPASVAAVPAGHRLAVTVSSTDQAYQGSPDPAVWRVSVADSPSLGVPLIPGRAANANTVPTGPLVGIVLIVLVAAVTGLVSAFRGARSTAAQSLADAPPLVVRSLRKDYPGGVTAVDGVSFTVGRNQVVGLLGPNGAGKTTALRMLIGLIHPSGGEVSLFGHPVSPGGPVLSRIGSFVEGPGLLPHLSGAENLRLYWAATGRPSADARQDEVLEIAGLGTAIRRPVRTYSQGMRQRLAIAQAMLGLPELLVLDEPTNGLDPPQIHAMREVLRGYATDGRSVLVSSHLLAEVEQTCDHVIVMHRGTVVADGSVAELVAGGGQATFRVDDPRRAAEVLAALGGVTGIEVDGPSVHAALNGTPRSDAVKHLVDAGLEVESVGARRRLEDAFLALIGEDNTP